MHTSQLVREEISWKAPADSPAELTKKVVGVGGIEAVAVGRCSSHDIALLEAVKGERLVRFH